MLKILSAIVAAAAVAGVLVVVPGLSKDVNASTQIYDINQTAKADRLEIKVVSAATCSERAWPYYDRTCVRNEVSADRRVRVITPELKTVR
jgi:hypothetical protein